MSKWRLSSQNIVGRGLALLKSMIKNATTKNWRRNAYGESIVSAYCCHNEISANVKCGHPWSFPSVIRLSARAANGSS